MVDFEIVPLTEGRIAGALKVMRQSFWPDEKFSIGVRLLDDSPEIRLDYQYKCTVGTKEVEDLCIDIAKDGVTLVAVDKTTNKVIGVAWNKLQVKVPGQPTYFEKFVGKHFTDHCAIAFMDYMIMMNAKMDLFQRFNADCIMELVFLAVKSTVKGQGVGTALVSGAAALAQSLKDNPVKDKPTPKAFNAVFTGRGSQACGRKSGLTHLVRTPYTEFLYGGSTFDKVLGPDHPFCTLSAKKLD